MDNPMLQLPPSATAADVDDGQVPLGLHISAMSLHDIDTTKETATVCLAFGSFRRGPLHHLRRSPTAPR